MLMEKMASDIALAAELKLYKIAAEGEKEVKKPKAPKMPKAPAPAKAPKAAQPPKSNGGVKPPTPNMPVGPGNAMPVNAAPPMPMANPYDMYLRQLLGI